MQRMYDEKYIKGMQMIHSGLIGDVVGLRCHWFRNADWRRPVPSPELERKINWRLYKESSGGLMTELACHQLEVCNWAAKKCQNPLWEWVTLYTGKTDEKFMIASMSLTDTRMELRSHTNQ